MDQDKKLEKQVQDYAGLAKENPNIDVAALMISTLQNQNKNYVSPKLKRWAYIISISLPPLGLLFALRFYLGDEEDGRYMGNVCLILTIISIVLFWLIGKSLFSSTGVDLRQIQQIKPQDIQQLTQ